MAPEVCYVERDGRAAAALSSLRPDKDWPDCLTSKEDYCPEGVARGFYEHGCREKTWFGWRRVFHTGEKLMG